MSSMSDHELELRFQEATAEYERELQQFNARRKFQVTAIWIDFVLFSSPIIFGVLFQSGHGVLFSIAVYLIARAILFTKLKEHGLPMWGCFASFFLPLPTIALSCLLYRDTPPKKPNLAVWKQQVREADRRANC